MPLWIHIDEDKDKDDKKGWIHLAQKFDSKDEDGEGNYLEYETGRSNSADNGVFIDRAFLYTNESGSTTTTTIIRRGWKMEAVEGKNNTYKLYTYSNSSNTSASFDTTNKYYLIAAETQGDVDKNCGAVVAGSTEIANGNDEWRFLSYQQIFELQVKNTNNITSSIDLTFRLQCPDFSRENAAMSKWKAYQYGGSGQIRLGLQHYYKPYVKKAMEQLPAAILRSMNIIPHISKITSATHFPMTAKLSEKTRITSVIAVSIIALMPRISEAPSTRMSL